ncbi:Arc family DNA-binding protein [Pseudomonas sp. D47]|uniref:Arc family DNA-binding protein n=1 Tax=Pseudomonas sp. D47 TaxID=3159447 RepID=UPI00387ACA66
MSTKSAVTQLIYSFRTADKFAAGLPEVLRDRVNLAAENNRRRVNSEMIARIDGSLDLESKYEEIRQLNRYL